MADGGQAIPVTRVSDIMGGLVKQVADGGLVRFPNCLANGGHAGAAQCRCQCAGCAVPVPSPASKVSQALSWSNREGGRKAKAALDPDQCGFELQQNRR